MVNLMPSAGVNPLVSDQFRFQKVIPGNVKQSYVCQCGAVVDQVTELDWQEGGLAPEHITQQLVGQKSYGSPDAAMFTQQVPINQSKEPTLYPSDAPDVCCSCPNCNCLQHRPAAPTPISMSGACDPCRKAGGANACCPPQPNRPLHPVVEGWSYCPPIHMDPKSLIRPRDKSLPDSTRPTGAPYFAQEKKPSCPPYTVPKPMKSSFTCKDWLSTVNDREPKDCLRGCCIPSLCTWCAPVYYDCCTDMNDPSSYVITRQSLPPFY